jgi:serine/threonine protein kinase
MVLLTIDSDISSEHLSILRRFVRLIDDDTNVLEIGEEFIYRRITYQLQDTIVRRKKKNSDDENVYEVMSTSILGKGGFSEVFKVRGVLSIQADDTLIYTKKPKDKKRAVKLYDTNKSTFDEVMQEFNKIKDIAHLHAKAPVKISVANKRKIASFQRRHPGEELFDLIVKLNKNPKFYTLKQRFDLAIALLEALDKQVHQHGLLHRDIKPENIMVAYDKKTKRFIVNIIDFNLSCKIGSEDNSVVGTKYYMPNEAWRGVSDKSRDYFSMALVIGMLFDAYEPKFLFAQYSSSTSSGRSISSESCDNSNCTVCNKEKNEVMSESESADGIVKSMEQSSSCQSSCSNHESSASMVSYSLSHDTSSYSCSCSYCVKRPGNRQFDGNYDFAGIFRHCDYMSEGVKLSLLALLKAMTSEDIKARPTFEGALKILKIIHKAQDFRLYSGPFFKNITQKTDNSDDFKKAFTL